MNGFRHVQNRLQRPAVVSGAALEPSKRPQMPAGRHGAPTPLPGPRFGNTAAGGSGVLVQCAGAAQADALASAATSALLHHGLTEEEAKKARRREQQKLQKQNERKRKMATAEGAAKAREEDARRKRASRLKTGKN